MRFRQWRQMSTLRETCVPPGGWVGWGRRLERSATSALSCTCFRHPAQIFLQPLYDHYSTTTSVRPANWVFTGDSVTNSLSQVTGGRALDTRQKPSEEANVFICLERVCLELEKATRNHLV